MDVNPWIFWVEYNGGSLDGNGVHDHDSVRKSPDSKIVVEVVGQELFFEHCRKQVLNHGRTRDPSSIACKSQGT